MPDNPYYNSDRPGGEEEQRQGSTFWSFADPGNVLGFNTPGTPEYPGMSAEERRLLNLIAQSYEYGFENLQLLMPDMLMEARIGEVTTPADSDAARRASDLDSQISDTRSQMVKLRARRVRGVLPSDLKQELADLESTLADLQSEREGIEGIEEVTSFQRLDYDEWLSRLDPDQREEELIKAESRSNLMRLLSGREEAIPALDATYDKIREETHARLASAGIQPGSTGYAQAMAETERNIGLLGTQLRESAFGMARAGAGGLPTGPDYTPALTGAGGAMGAPIGTALQAYASERAGQFSSDMLKYEQTVAGQQNWLDLAGSVGGLVAGS